MNALPQRFGPYEIVQPLGVGGMAETFVALRRGPAGFEQQVCLKRVLPAYARDEHFMKLFLGEARLVAHLRHANIVQLTDFGESEGLFYLALELVEGLDLREVLARLRMRDAVMDPELVALVASDVATALEYAHNLAFDAERVGVVHRDVSPGNVLLSLAGEIKLADFGIAKSALAEQVTQSGVVKGKIPYMSPEQARGEVVDARSDLFSLGVLMYEALAGQRPFDGATEAATLLKIVEGRHIPLRELVPSLPEALCHLVDRLLAHEAGERFADASEFLEALFPHVPPPTARRRLGSLIRDLRERPTFSPEIADTLPARRLRLEFAPQDAPQAASPADKAEEPLNAEAWVAEEPAASGKEVETPSLPEGVDEGNEEAPAFLSARRRSRFPWVVLSGLTLALTAWLGLFAPWKAGSSALKRNSAEHEEKEHGKAKAQTIAPRGESAPPEFKTKPTPTVRTDLSKKAASAAGTPTSPKPTPALEAPAEAEETLPSTAGAGALYRIRVVPWGIVWIDGKRVGRDSVEVRLEPGRHVLATGAEAPSTRRKLKVEENDVGNARAIPIVLKRR